MKKIRTIAAAAVVGLTFASSASAATLYCPGDFPSLDYDRYLEVTPTDAIASCVDHGTEPNADKTFEETAFGSELIQIAADLQGDGSGSGGYLSVTSGSLGNGTSGSFDLTDSGDYLSYVILFKFGNPDTSESWFAISVDPTDTVAGIDWASIYPNGDEYTRYALSHVTLYGAVPLPASALLLLGGLGGLAALRRRKKAA